MVNEKTYGGKTLQAKPNAPKLSVWAPRTPGCPESIVGECDTMEQAREIASRYEGRKDLRMQDVVIRLGRDGEIIEKCGPCN